MQNADLKNRSAFFAFIAGYTPGGIPYGITWEEQAELDHKERTAFQEEAEDDFELPF